MNQSLLIRSLMIACALLINATSAPSDFDFDNPAVEQFIGTTTFNTPQSRAPIPIHTLVPILEQLGFIDVLKEPLFTKTYPLNKRYILDLPTFTFPWHHCRCKEFGAQIFFNSTDRMAFVKDCTNISSYLNIAGEGFIEKLQIFLNNIPDVAADFNPELPIELLSLVENFTVQERNLGVMFDGEQKINDCRLRWFVPVYYNERNHFVNPDIEAELQRIARQFFGPGDCDAQWEFTRKYLIADRLGVGDFRLEFDFPVYDSNCFQARFGFMADAPVSFSFKRGLLGNEFCPACPKPTLNLEDVLDNQLALEDIAESDAVNYFLAALSNLSNMLLSTGLGNDGHAGIGVLLRTKTALSSWVSQPWAESITWQGRTSIEYLLPNRKLRPFTQKINLADFTNRDFENEDPIVANDNYQFLVKTLTDRLFPAYLYAHVWPGVVLRSTSRAVWENESWGAHVGTDLWIRTAETITSVEASGRVFNSLKLSAGERPLAYQSKMFGGVAKRVCLVSDRELTLSLNADTTYIGSGIGHDYTITFNIDFNF